MSNGNYEISGLPGQGNYLAPGFYLDLPDSMGQSTLNREIRIFGPGFQEQLDDIPGIQIRPFSENSADSPVVMRDTV